MSQLNLQQAFESAVRHHQAGRLPEADALYRQILAQDPRHAGAIYLRGLIARQSGRSDIAAELMRSAIAIKSDWPEAWCNLGHALRDQGKFAESIVAYHRSIALRPDDADLYVEIGNTCIAGGKMDDAITAYQRAIAIKPTYAGALINLGNAFRVRGELDHAIGAYQRAVEIDPKFLQALTNLAVAWAEKGRLEQAAEAYRQAVILRPGDAQLHLKLGIVLNDMRQFRLALAPLRQAIALKPDFAEACSDLGNALGNLGQPDDAIASYRRAIQINPKLAVAHNNLGNALKDMGDLDQAMDCYRHAEKLSRTAAIGSNLIVAMQYHPKFDDRAIADELRRWNQRHAEPLQPARPVDVVVGQARLRIGYVSPDFCDHVVARNLLPLFKNHDHTQLEIFVYSHVACADSMTAQFQQLADGWRNIAGLSDPQAADQIRKDGIDILVDLALHTSHNRLLLFARKPAPVLATFAGYPGSTGLTSMDFRLTDPYLDPVGMDESIYSEKTLRLTSSFWCYDPTDCADIPVNPQPAIGNGFVTFACLNNFCKINDQTLQLWADVLRQVENSRLLLRAPLGSHRQRTLGLLQQNGVDPARVEFVAHQSRRQYLQTYHRIDLGLDTFPYNGHSTSLDSFWMGVPVVTMIGTRAVARAGFSQLSNLKMTELAGKTSDEFVSIAVDLAKDSAGLSHLRSTLRLRMEQSPLMDAIHFAHEIELAYQKMRRSILR